MNQGSTNSTKRESIYVFSTTISFVFDIDTAKWYKLEYVLNARENLFLSMVGEQLYLVGGNNYHTESSLSSVEVVDENYNTTHLQ